MAMSGKDKKRLQRIVDAVSAILGDEEEVKKLRKVKALERFIGKLEARERELAGKASAGARKGKEARQTSRHVGILQKQIKKASDLLVEMKK